MLQNTYGNSFAALRLLAALQVVYVHSFAHLGLPALPLHEWIAQLPGVPVFFAISGYLVLGSLMRLGVADFLMHRALRIYPALFVNIAVLELAVHLTGGGFNLSFAPLSAIVSFETIYALTASWGLAFDMSGIAELCCRQGWFQIYPSGVLWTLTVELTFYATVVLFAGAAKSRGAVSIALVILSVMSLAWPPEYGALTVAPYFWMFAIGMLFRLWPPSAEVAKWLWLPLACIFVASAFARDLAWLDWKTSRDAATLLETAVLCAFAVSVGLSPLLASRTVDRYDISYGVYLYHMLFVAAAMNLPAAARGYWLYAAVAVLSVASGFLSSLVEQPAMRWAKRNSANRNGLRHAGDADLQRGAVEPNVSVGRGRRVYASRYVE